MMPSFIAMNLLYYLAPTQQDNNLGFVFFPPSVVLSSAMTL
jgi:hypothetical protein